MKQKEKNLGGIETSPQKTAYTTVLIEKYPDSQTVSRWIEKLSKEESPKLFPIKGHHVLYPYLHFLHENKSILNFFSQKKQNIKKREVINAITTFVKNYFIGMSETDRSLDYLIDIFGENHENSTNMAYQLTRLLYGLINWDGKTTVNLTMEKKDGICDATCHGEHCDLTDWFGQIYDTIFIGHIVHASNNNCKILAMHSYKWSGEAVEKPKEVLINLDVFRLALSEAHDFLPQFFKNE